VGTNVVTLTVTDAYGASDSCTALVIVQGPRELFSALLALVSDQAPRGHPLLSTLEAAMSSMERQDLGAAMNQLEAFQHQVRAQVARSDPALAQTLVEDARLIADLLENCGQSHQ
jgi:hypothetical protein